MIAGAVLTADAAGIEETGQARAAGGVTLGAEQLALDRQASVSERPIIRPFLEQVLLRETNRVRARYRRPALRRSAVLARPARSHSRYLVGLGKLSHDSRGGAPFWTRLVAAGFPRSRAMGENLALIPGCGPAAALRAVRMWLASAGHRRNLLNPRFRLMGAGAVSAPRCAFTVFTADYGSR